MKAAIITYSNAQNFGAQLQAYALTNYIDRMGHDAQLIEYRKFDDRWFKPRKTVGDIFATLFFMNACKKRVARFQNFRDKYLSRTSLCSNSEELKKLNKEFDAFISGSDQVWNCNGRVNDDFFLRFCEREKRKIAYAPSFGSAQIPVECEKKVASYISDFDYVSTREESGTKIIERLTNKDVRTVLDPVFLLSKEEWNHIIPQKKQEPFIFVYTTQINDRLAKLVRKLQKEKNAIVYSTQYISGCRCKVCKDAGPLEFLQLVRDAGYVISTSFHATAFSIIFEKDFCVLPHSETGARVTDLLTAIGLEGAVVKDAERYEFYYQKNEETIKNLLQEKIEISQEYLKKVFEE